jgi:riboflavin biosynthesis pyrimidine reductase
MHVCAEARVPEYAALAGHGVQWRFTVRIARIGAGTTDDTGASATSDPELFYSTQAIADVVVISAGTLRADSRHLWTAAAIFPQLAQEYRQLSHSLGNSEAPLNVIVSGSGSIDLGLPVFASGKVQTLILSTAQGAKRSLRQAVPDSVEVRAIGRGARVISARAILDSVWRGHPARPISVEGGPRLLGDFYAARLLDEQFLTLAPQIAGREAGMRRPRCWSTG